MDYPTRTHAIYLETTSMNQQQPTVQIIAIGHKMWTPSPEEMPFVHAMTRLCTDLLCGLGPCCRAEFVSHVRALTNCLSKSDGGKDAAVAPGPLVFGTTPPKEPGWYWCESTGRNGGTETMITWRATVRVDHGEGGRMMATWLTGPGFAAMRYVDESAPQTMWAGPIPEPTLMNESCPPKPAEDKK